MAVAAVSESKPSVGPGIVAAGVYSAGRRVTNIAIDQAGEWARKAGHVVWIGLLEPDDALLRQVQAQFGLDPLAIEDAGKAHQRPKIEQYGDGLFIVARTAEMIDGRISFGETHLFVGRGYVVSVRHGPSVSYTFVRERCESAPTMLARGETYILYSILDFIVDNYLVVLERVHAEAEHIENAVLAMQLDQEQIERLYLLRRDLLHLRNGVAPLVEVCHRLEHAEVITIDSGMQLFFRDVTDHVQRVQEEIAALREMLAFAFEASLLTNQSEQTAITRRLAAWAAILAVPTALAGIYGMNFEHMPELRWTYGYFVVIGLVVAICVILYLRFRSRHWL